MFSLPINPHYLLLVHMFRSHFPVAAVIAKQMANATLFRSDGKVTTTNNPDNSSKPNSIINLNHCTVKCDNIASLCRLFLAVLTGSPMLPPPSRYNSPHNQYLSTTVLITSISE